VAGGSFVLGEGVGLGLGSFGDGVGDGLWGCGFSTGVTITGTGTVTVGLFVFVGCVGRSSWIVLQPHRQTPATTAAATRGPRIGASS
jgi:hypothetical protein